MSRDCNWPARYGIEVGNYRITISIACLIRDGDHECKHCHACTCYDGKQCYVSSHDRALLWTKTLKRKEPEPVLLPNLQAWDLESKQKLELFAVPY